MPFPNKEIEAAYQNSLSIVQGSFREDEGLLYVYEEYRKLYQKLTDVLGSESKADLDSLIEMEALLREYEEKHGFTEGWLSAKRKSDAQN